MLNGWRHACVVVYIDKSAAHSKGMFNGGQMCGDGTDKLVTLRDLPGEWLTAYWRPEILRVSEDTYSCWSRFYQRIYQFSMKAK